MQLSAKGRRSRGAIFLAVLQAVLLISALALGSAQVVAQSDAAAPPNEQATTQGDAGQAAVPDRGLYVKPRKARLEVGDTLTLTAWLCKVPAKGNSPFGPDRKPGTGDDGCARARIVVVDPGRGRDALRHLGTPDEGDGCRRDRRLGRRQVGVGVRPRESHAVAPRSDAARMGRNTGAPPSRGWPSQPSCRR